ncbi:MAG TPA: DUF2071 domain-containing protein [Vicinamibacteria bacterium]|nr:DUF2071 domain-containing protein [Vicinamibacteria bacterium]
MEAPVAEPRPFLTAHWRHLAILNYEVDPGALAGHVPRGTELECDAARLYGERFARALGGPPVSAFLAVGSPVRVFSGVRVA